MDNSKTSRMENKNMSIIDGIYKAFAVGDIPTVLGSMDSKIVWNEAEGNAYTDGNPYLGPEVVLNGVFGRILDEQKLCGNSCP